MIEKVDIERLIMPSLTHLTSVQVKRITNAENACKNSMSDWAKDYWFNIFQTLCKKYDAMEYFRKVIH
jgi:hypothetical protein